MWLLHCTYCCTDVAADIIFSASNALQLHARRQHSCTCCNAAALLLLQRHKVAADLGWLSGASKQVLLLHNPGCGKKQKLLQSYPVASCCTRCYYPVASATLRLQLHPSRYYSSFQCIAAMLQLLCSTCSEEEEVATAFIVLLTPLLLLRAGYARLHTLQQNEVGLD